MTIQEIAKEVLFEVGELATGQTPTAADLKVCTDAYSRVWAMLQVPELLAGWAVDADIPTIAEQPIIALVAFDVRNKFGIGGETMQTIIQNAGLAKPQLRANVHTNWLGDDEDPIEEDYF